MNKVTLIGTVVSSPKLLYVNKKGVEKYQFMVMSKRLSNNEDILPVITNDLNIVKDIQEGDRVWIDGSYLSFNKIIEGKSKLKLNIFANHITILTENSSYVDDNVIEFTGTICKQPIMRKTPLGKTITDLLIAVNRDNSEFSDYIPTITWGSAAIKAADLKVGDKVTLNGRIQSRVYTKNEQDFITYEVSVAKLTEEKL